MARRAATRPRNRRVYIGQYVAAGPPPEPEDHMIIRLATGTPVADTTNPSNLISPTNIGAGVLAIGDILRMQAMFVATNITEGASTALVEIKLAGELIAAAFLQLGGEEPRFAQVIVDVYIGDTTMQPGSIAHQKDPSNVHVEAVTPAAIDRTVPNALTIEGTMNLASEDVTMTLLTAAIERIRPI